MLRRATVTRAVLCAACMIACEPEPNPGVCSGDGDPGIEIRQRMEDSAIEDGSDLPVFPPPQGGVWTEMDVTLVGVRDVDVATLRVDIVDSSATILGSEVYRGDGLPLACQVDGTLKIDNMPVGFNDGTILQDLDGVPVTMTTTLTRSDGGDTVSSLEVTLRVGVF